MLKRRTKCGPIGLDIGASSIKMLQLTGAGREPAILAAAHLEIAPTAVDPGESVRTAIAAALRRHPFQGRRVVTALCGDEFQMKNIRLPRMPKAEMASAVEFEAQERFAFGGRPAQIRHIPVGEVRHGEELKEEIIVLAAFDEVVEARLAMLESLKLRPMAIDIAPCAVARNFARFLRRAEDVNAINVFLDVGQRGTSVVFMRGVEISFLKRIDIGGKSLNNAVGKAMGISAHEAADLRVRIMREGGGRRAADHSGVPEEIRASAADAVRPLIERLSRDVQLCMRYFAVTFRGRKPESLTLVGGEAHEPSLMAILSEAIDVPCLIGHPLRGIGGIGLLGGSDRRSLQPAWAVAGGLALLGSPWIGSSSAVGGSLAMRSPAVGVEA